MQGSTKEEQIMIFDWKHPLMNRKWLWVAITRTTNLDNAICYDYAQETVDTTLLYKYLDIKIKSYMDVDRSCNRTIDTTSFVDRDWFLRHLGTDCQNCGMCMCLSLIHI